MGESGAWTTELLVMVVMASSLVSRKLSPKLVKEVCTVMTMGTMRKTARKKEPGNRYLPGMKRLVEYRAKIAADRDAAEDGGYAGRLLPGRGGGGCRHCR